MNKMKKMRLTLEDLINKNKEELINDKALMEKIDKQIEDKILKSGKTM